MKWQKIQDRKIGGNISVIYEKGNLTLELFRDALWQNKSMNVIIRDASKESLTSSLGKTIRIRYCGNETEAKEWAKKFMGER